jgi:hypothetical protein
MIEAHAFIVGTLTVARDRGRFSTSRDLEDISTEGSVSEGSGAM